MIEEPNLKYVREEKRFDLPDENYYEGISMLSPLVEVASWQSVGGKGLFAKDFIPKGTKIWTFKRNSNVFLVRRPKIDWIYCFDSFFAVY